MADQLDEVARIVEAAVLRPGDRLILRLDPSVSPAEMDPLGELLRERLPDVQVLLLGGAVEMVVVPSTSTTPVESVDLHPSDAVEAQR